MLTNLVRTTARFFQTQYYQLTHSVQYTALNNHPVAHVVRRRGGLVLLVSIIMMLLLWLNTVEFDGGMTSREKISEIINNNSFLSSKGGKDPLVNVQGYYTAQGLLPNYTDAGLPVTYTDPETKASIIDFDRSHAKFIPTEIINELYHKTDLEAVDWSRYAYVLYATSPAHLCNAFMIFSELRNYGSKADMVLIVNEQFLDEKNIKYSKQLKELRKQEANLRLTYRPVEVVTKTDIDAGKAIWMSSFTKLLVFGEVSYDRIIYMDADAVLTKSHLDELFFMPDCKLASPSGYWLTQETFSNERDQMLTKYPIENYNWKPRTVQERARDIWQYSLDFIHPFLNPETEKLDHSKMDAAALKTYQNMLYSNLPSYYTLDEFLLTNIIMVIQPTEELFETVKKGIEERDHSEFDMDIMQRLFHLPTTIKSQTASALNETKTFKDRLNEVPEFLILPATAYGTLSSEFNRPPDEYAFYAADPVDQLYATNPESKRLAAQLQKETNSQPPYWEIEQLTQAPGDYLNRNVKYYHFSDAPIPKPWFYFDPKDGYMGHRIRCPTFREFVNTEEYKDVVKPGRGKLDCSFGEVWEMARNMFTRVREQVCGLPLQRADGKNTYFDIIN
ncbi:hypothetical protein WICPIJ_000759 [Wickerhamomyces pijperi]|uniref:Glycosyltransferase family 8 protein n=1 Tax=Wickerhamomyces pijperi TaxID=599730 RepID=A0A9P8QD25_WICPI|nr:hypothetical protein WICPIJ_000759 [Wickerhamomyces pijperi]